MKKQTIENKGCGKEIQIITGEGIIMRTIKCGVPQTEHIDYIGFIEYCYECQARRRNDNSTI